MDNLILWSACTAVVVIAGWYVMAPLFKKEREEIDFTVETELDWLSRRKATAFSNSKDIELELPMGQLPERDFQQLSASYKNESTVILQPADQLSAPENLEQTIEREIAARKKALYGSASKRISQPSRCPSCGAKVMPGKKYCADCGHRLSVK